MLPKTNSIAYVPTHETSVSLLVSLVSWDINSPHTAAMVCALVEGWARWQTVIVMPQLFGINLIRLQGSSPHANVPDGEDESASKVTEKPCVMSN